MTDEKPNQPETPTDPNVAALEAAQEWDGEDSQPAYRREGEGDSDE